MNRKMDKAKFYGYDPEKVKQTILIISGGDTQKEIAEKIGILPKSVSDSMNGLRQWKTEELIKLADIYNTSVDYILGRVTNTGHTTGETSEAEKICNAIINLHALIKTNIGECDLDIDQIRCTDKGFDNNDYCLKFKYSSNPFPYCLKHADILRDFARKYTPLVKALKDIGYSDTDIIPHVSALIKSCIDRIDFSEDDLKEIEMPDFLKETARMTNVPPYKI